MVMPNFTGVLLASKDNRRIPRVMQSRFHVSIPFW